MVNKNKKTNIIFALILANLILGGSVLTMSKINKVEKNIDTKIENSEDSIKELINTRENQIITMIEGGYTNEETIKILVESLNEKKQDLQENKTPEEPVKIYTPNYAQESKTSEIPFPKYTVKKGDTLSEILFEQYGDYYLSGIKAVAKINNIKDVNNIDIGDVLEIPYLEVVKEMQKEGLLDDIKVANWKTETKKTSKTEEVKNKSTTKEADSTNQTSETLQTEKPEQTKTEENKELTSEKSENTTPTEEISKPVFEKIENTTNTEETTLPVEEEVVAEEIPEIETIEPEEIEPEILPEIEEITSNDTKNYNKLMEDEIVNDVINDEELISETLPEKEPELEVIEETQSTEKVEEQKEFESPYNSNDYQSSMFDDKLFNSLDWHLNLNNLIDPEEKEEEPKNETQSTEKVEEFNEKKGFTNEELEEYEYIDEESTKSNTEPIKPKEYITPKIYDMIFAYKSKER